jgi:membrane-bound lytic murein transglycosylase D
MLALVLLSGCATQVPSTPTDPKTAEAAASAPAPAASAAEASAPAATEPVAATEPAPPEPAVAVPIDPLRPEVTIDLNDLAARADLWARVRKGFAIPDLQGDLVHDREQWYASRPDYVQRMTERGGRYLFYIVEELERRNMPTELALLPFIESAFNPQAMSTAKASGMWQFIPSTGRNFALKQNVFRDDRRDVLASTRAALDYLGKLYGMFGDWHLALAAYNWGEGSVARAIARNQRAGLPTDYASLHMPSETANYVPKLQAVKNIVAHPENYSLALPTLRNHPYFIGVPITRDIDVELAARLAGISVDDFKNLNPQMNKPVILAAGTPQVLLPYDSADNFVRELNGHRGAMATWTAWVVPRTLRPAEAARQVGMNEAQLREVNHIPPHMLVKAGSTLLVPRNAQRQTDVSVHLADNAMMALAPEQAAQRRLALKAGRKDSVASVARRYRVSNAQVAQWNQVGAGASFTPGQTIVVYVAAHSPGRSKAVRVAAKKHLGGAGTARVALKPVKAPARATARE